MVYKGAMIGVGYVGLPLAVEAGKKHATIGFDINPDRIKQLESGFDKTHEVTASEIDSSKHLEFTNDASRLTSANFYILTVPTPIDQFKQPDLKPLKAASEFAARNLSRGDIVVYESTVYPGCTEEICVPILEKESGLKFNVDFFCGYSPERINPGDTTRRLKDIKKVTSGSTKLSAETVDEFYQTIIEAGTYKVSSIKVAEASKVIENSQRDINIAFVNELSLIFNRLGIDTHEVLEAAGTKWNFLPFKPGLVGGHCIGVDPYYLTYKAQSVGHNPEVILSGRRINDQMGVYIAGRIIKQLIAKGKAMSECRVMILGITFKENCPDIRNSKVVDLVNELVDYNLAVDIYDPLADKNDVLSEYGFPLVDEITENYDVFVLAVAHDIFEKLDWSRLKAGQPIVFDVKGFLSSTIYTDRL